ncbi:MAG: hypothetical protein AB1644_04430 [Candidatus Zixiibacteriota bacterium]
MTAKHLIASIVFWLMCCGISAAGEVPTASTRIDVPPKTDSAGKAVITQASISIRPDSVPPLMWQVMSDAGSEASSPMYRLSGTGGQTAVEYSSFGCLGNYHGFWQNFAGVCCHGIRGNVDYDFGDVVDISDLTYLVDWLFLVCSAILPCREEADINGDAVLDISDLAVLVDCLFGFGTCDFPACP